MKVLEQDLVLRCRSCKRTWVERPGTGLSESAFRDLLKQKKCIYCLKKDMRSRVLLGEQRAEAVAKLAESEATTVI